MFGSLAPTQFKRLTADGIVKTGQGNLVGFLVASGTPTLAIYDGTSAAGTLIINGLVCVAGTPYPVPVKFSAGLFVDFTNAGDVTFFYD